MTVVVAFVTVAPNLGRSHRRSSIFAEGVPGDGKVPLTWEDTGI
jgi:hypothetical protein